MNISIAGKTIFEARADSDAFVLTYTGHEPADTFCIRSACTDRIARLVDMVVQAAHATEGDLKMVIGGARRSGGSSRSRVISAPLTRRRRPPAAAAAADWASMVSAGDVRELVRTGLGRQQPGFVGSTVVLTATGLTISQSPLLRGMADRSLTITHDAIPGGYTVKLEERRVFCIDTDESYADLRDALDDKVYSWVGQVDADSRAALLQCVRGALQDWGGAIDLHARLCLPCRIAPVVSLNILERGPDATSSAVDAVDSLLDITA